MIYLVYSLGSFFAFFVAFQAVIEDIPDNLTTDRMWENARLHELLSSQTGLKAFKIIKDGTKRKLIVYLDNWINLKNLIGSEVRWDNKLFCWCKHTSPSQKSKSTKGNIPNVKKRRVQKADSNPKATPGNKNQGKKKIPQPSPGTKKTQKKNRRKPSKPNGGIDNASSSQFSMGDKKRLIGLFAEFLSNFY